MKAAKNSFTIYLTLHKKVFSYKMSRQAWLGWIIVLTASKQDKIKSANRLEER
ncbi:hypothetical protein [Lactobacillus equicursoris]|uniref:hypothetical protein n=1 Tax=Lactobacillus equicursoris TaxID=420645 RepID=UPI0039929F87